MDEQKNALNGLIRGILELLSDERLGQLNIRERAVMGRLARFMVPYYQGWDIDTDHERIGDDPKYLYVLPNGEPGEKPIIPDIIVHKLGVKENLLVVELKLHDNTNFALDLWKLTHMTRLAGMYAYMVGAHVVLNLRAQTITQALIYVDGSVNIELTDWFTAQIAR